MNRRRHQLRSSLHTERCNRAFTLTELLVAVALTLILMLAVSYIFSTTSQTVGTGQALGAALRQERNAKGVYDHDFASMSAVTADVLGLVISCQQITVPLNAVDAASNAANPHEADTVSFFQSGNFPRETGNTPSFTSPMRENEAWVWFGHVQALDLKSGNFLDPGTVPTSSAPNSDNYYASQWTLGRWQMLLVQKSATSTAMVSPYSSADSSSIIDGNGTPTAYIDCVNSPMGPLGYVVGGPAASNAVANAKEPYSASNAAVSVNQSRYDLGGLPAGADPFVSLKTAVGAAGWWKNLLYRFQFNAFPDRSVGLTSVGVSQVSPAFVSGCSDFTVEFAGDFYDQSGNGSEPPGTVDYDVSAGVHSIHWYGANAALTAPPVSGAARAGTSLIQQTAVSPFSANYAWGAPVGGVTPPRPQLIRLTMTVRDPNGRLADGRTSQFVYDVPQ